MAVDEGLLRLVQVDAVEALPRRREAHDEHPAHDDRPRGGTDLAEVDLGLCAERVMLGDLTLGSGTPPRSRDRGHVAANGRLADIGTVLFDETLVDPPGRVALLRGASLSSASQPSMIAFQGPSTGETRGGGGFRGGGTADAIAWRTVRRCVPNRSANARTDSPSRSCAFLICSNSSTLDLAIAPRWTKGPSCGGSSGRPRGGAKSGEHNRP